jgi:hypothetical protein
VTTSAGERPGSLWLAARVSAQFGGRQGFRRNGGLFDGDRHQAYESAVGFRAIGAAVVCASVAGFAAPPGVSAASTASGTAVVHGVQFPSNAITCPTATACLAGGGNSADDGVIVVINGSNGAATPAGTDAAMDPVSGLACPTATQCVAVGGVGDAVSVNGANGATGTNHAVTSEPTPIFYTAAWPTATTCLAGGTHDLFPGFETTFNGLSPVGVQSSRWRA